MQSAAQTFYNLETNLKHEKGSGVTLIISG